jgi:hypothetical protein
MDLMVGGFSNTAKAFYSELETEHKIEKVRAQ